MGSYHKGVIREGTPLRRDILAETRCWRRTFYWKSWEKSVRQRAQLYWRGEELGFVRNQPCSHLAGARWVGSRGQEGGRSQHLSNCGCGSEAVGSCKVRRGGWVMWSGRHTGCCGEKGLATHYHHPGGLDLTAWMKATAEGLTRRGWTWETGREDSVGDYTTCLKVLGKETEEESGMISWIPAGATRWLSCHFSERLVTQRREDEEGRENHSQQVFLWS